MIVWQDSNRLKIDVEQNNLMRKLLYIHKGIAGEICVIFSILFGISLLFSLLSGKVVAQEMPKLKRNTITFLLVGTVTILMIFIAS
ncbi:threonine synthase [Oceanobacter sp. RED65]|uniref:Threonine synthase n=1 Tax=Bermanella marisrubri TaxID=207949 RepID=Q1N0D9_9GAMM|nr:threonine synthase [Oceanobacter sp. RED65] [Bermanella marisrubri]